MINHALVRDRLAAAATVPGVTVYRLPPTGALSLPAVIVGMPEWSPTSDDLAGGCLDRTVWPVGVVVARPGSDDAATVTELEGLWPAVLGAISAAIDAGDLDDVAAHAAVQDAYFDHLTVQGQVLPAQTITIHVYG